MKYIVQFQDNPGNEHLRKTHMASHLEFLGANPNIIAAGPLFSAENNGCGGMWLVNAPDTATVFALTRDDPLFNTGLRKNIEILEWHQVFCDGKRLI